MALQTQVCRSGVRWTSLSPAQVRSPMSGRLVTVVRSPSARLGCGGITSTRRFASKPGTAMALRALFPPWDGDSEAAQDGPTHPRSMLNSADDIEQFYSPYTEHMSCQVEWVDDDVGKRLVAKHNLDANEIIMCELPLTGHVIPHETTEETCGHCFRSLEHPRDRIPALCNELSIEWWPHTLLPTLENYPNEKNPHECRSKCGIRYCSPECEVAAWEEHHHLTCLGEEIKTIGPDGAHRGSDLLSFGESNVIYASRLIAQLVTYARKYAEGDDDGISYLQQYAGLMQVSELSRRQDIIQTRLDDGTITDPNIRQQLESMKDNLSAHQRALHKAVCKYLKIDEVELPFEVFDLIMGTFSINGTEYQPISSCQEFANICFEHQYQDSLLASGISHEMDSVLNIINTLTLNENMPSIMCSGLFPVHSCINHSCAPNARLASGVVPFNCIAETVYQRELEGSPRDPRTIARALGIPEEQACLEFAAGFPSNRLFLVSTNPIHKGKEITISYLPREMTIGKVRDKDDFAEAEERVERRRQRRALLKRRYLFDCECFYCQETKE